MFDVMKLECKIMSNEIIDKLTNLEKQLETINKNIVALGKNLNQLYKLILAKEKGYKPI